MFKRKKNDSAQPSAADSASRDRQDNNVQTGGWDDHVKVRSRQFNGPAGVDESVRVMMTKDAYADLIGHTKETLDREICGVLMGDLCEDEHGRFISVQTTIRGGAAKTGGTHVTFTQETWNEIHAAKEQRCPKLQIVGWYHSHPGFGVEFSDMDLFIQKNFFGGPSQIAFVSDPLGGEEAICANYNGQIVPVQRFWVDGRERRCYVPRAEKSPGLIGAAPTGGASDAMTGSLRDLQDRVRQLTDVIEQQRNSFYSVLTFLVVLVAGCFLAGTGYWIWRSYARPIQIPEEMQNEFTLPTPIIVGGKPAIVTLSAKKWTLSPEYEDQLWQVLSERRKAQEEAAAAATQKASTAPATGKAASQPASPGSASTPPKPAIPVK
ncbi:MAG: Mov34/MPN/PAD-1 family protein [Phycisphaerae bacterium]